MKQNKENNRERLPRQWASTPYETSRRIRPSRPVRDGIGARPFIAPEVGEAYELILANVPGVDSSQLQEAFFCGDIRDLFSRPLSPSSRLGAGEKIWIFSPIPDEPDRPIKLPVVAETEQWIIVDKPHGLATMPRGSHVAQTVTIAARRQFSNDEIVPAHRLDADTAGLVLLIKRREDRGAYQKLFESRTVKKTYHCVARAALFEHHHSALSLVKEHGVFAGEVRTCPDAPVNALTDIEMLTRFALLENNWILPPRLSYGGSEVFADDSENFALYKVSPLTGKTHQIRIAFAHLGLGLLGDRMYPLNRFDEDFGLPLQLLAYGLEFRDPYEGADCHITSSQKLIYEDC